MKRSILLALGVAAGALASTQSVQAANTMSATYFSVPNNGAASDPDFEHAFTVPNITIGSSLGPNGLPVATSPFGVSDIGPSNQITWWSPALNSNVTQTGTGVITLPYSNGAMFPPNSTGSSDSNAFETAIFKGALNVTTGGTVSFNLSSDDDALIYVNGTYIGGLPGIHATQSTTVTDTLAAGSYSLEVFYADRHTVAATFGLDITGATVGAPGPNVGEGLLSFAAMSVLLIAVRNRGLLV